MKVAQSIDTLNVDMGQMSVAQAIDALNVETSTQQALRISAVSPEDGATGVDTSAGVLFDWSDSEGEGVYRLVASYNSDLSIPVINRVVEGTQYQYDSSLTQKVYWKLFEQNVTDRPAIVPDNELFTGMTVWDANTEPAPIYYPNDIYVGEANAPDGIAPIILDAINDLADYIQQSSGKTRPQIVPVSQNFDTFPQRCIKVGFPNSLTGREEIQIKCSENGPIELTGVDEFDPQNPDWVDTRTETDFMSQAGSYHAVMSFIHDNLGVVWGWPGPLGEAVPQKSELKIDVIDKKHVPSALDRVSIKFSTPGNRGFYSNSKEWAKKQRAFYSLNFNVGHGFSSYYDKYHPDGNDGNPTEFVDLSVFALQPDGTRSGFPFGADAKVEVGNPDLPNFWYNNTVTQKLQENPLTRSFNVAPGDSFFKGHSVDLRAKAMDYPPQGFVLSGTSTTIVSGGSESTPFVVNEHVGKQIRIDAGTNIGQTRTIASNTENEITVSTPFTNPIDSTSFYYIIEPDVEFVNFIFEDRSLSLPTTTDREIAFTKRCIDVISQQYPNMLVATQAYGFTRIPPKRESVDGYENLVIQGVFNDLSDPTENPQFTQWRQVFPSKYLWRPNLGDAYGHNRGAFFTHVHAVGNKYKTLIDENIIGLKPDSFWEIWGTQWPMYYTLHQIAWDNTQDVDAVMNKAYDTLFGDASIHIKNYYEYTESIIDQNYELFTPSKSLRLLWSESVINTLQGHLNNAFTSVNPDSDEHERIEFVQAGLNWVKALRRMSEYFYEYDLPAVGVDGINRATLANAIEDDTDAITGWSQQFGDFDVISQSEVTNGSNFAFAINSLDPSSDAGTKSILRDPLPVGDQVSGTADSGTSDSLTDSALSLTIDSEQDRLLRITAGTNVGEERQIVSNTSDTITTKYPFSQPIDATSEYEIVTLYLVSIDMKHGGTGGDWCVFPLSDFNRLRRVSSSRTDWQTISLFMYGGDRLGIRELNENNDGFVYADNLIVEKAVPVDRIQIASDWEASNAAAIEEAEDPKWGDYPPIGIKAILELPYPGDTESGEPDAGVI